jgi:RNA polymerase sigma-70 factor (ECF subfamily)
MVGPASGLFRKCLLYGNKSRFKTGSHTLRKKKLLARFRSWLGNAINAEPNKDFPCLPPVNSGTSKGKGIQFRRSLTLSDEDSFRTLIRRVRAGDSQATTELVRKYEPAIRLAVHVRLTDPRLRRILDSMDICQSVFFSFFARVASGEYELNTPEQLLKLLTTMARNKVITYAHKHKAARRDYRRLQDDSAARKEFVDPSPTPGELVAEQELLHEFRNRMTEDVRRLADLRVTGLSWDEVAAQVGGNPNALRMKLTRALDRISRELGLDQ